MTKHYSIGIDLGTSNSALALADIENDNLLTLDISQVVSADATCERQLLPSALYIPHQDEFTDKDLRLPWNESRPVEFIIGEYARERGLLAPDRLILSAKSWLCNNHIDQKSNILPWGSEVETGKRSPFEASRLYLEHLRLATEKKLTEFGADLGNCQVVLTVPASFDESARRLTHEAAVSAGWGEVTLLEEPLAAFYAWIHRHNSSWNKLICDGDLVLVCDVGGGTADFSLIAVTERNGNLELERISVGEHILLGGDNMDLALAYFLRSKLEEAGQSLDNWQFMSLIQSARIAKEKLFAEDELQEIPISIASRGASLFARTVSVTLSREELLRVIVEGFFPLTEASVKPEEKSMLGIQEWGLDFASDPALSKHLAYFLSRSLENTRSDNKLSQLVGTERVSPEMKMLFPTAVLFNGGVFKASCLRSRVMDLLRSWNPSAGEQKNELRELPGAEFDLAVARGAGYYGTIGISGKGLRIRSGVARSYYLGLETTMLAVPGYRPPVKGLCIVPQGMEEGTEFILNNNQFRLVTGKPVVFRFFSSAVRAGDKPGFIVSDAEALLDELANLRVQLPGENEIVPVKIQVVVTELGTLELWLMHTQSDKRWKLEFNLRQET